MRFPYPLIGAQLSTAPLMLALALALGTPSPADAQTLKSQPFDITIAAQPLSQALTELARQTRATLVVSPTLLAGKTAPAVSGKLTARQALDRLLSGSGLAGSLNGDAIMVQPAPSSLEGASLPPVIVKGTVVEETATGPVEGHAARRSATGTKTDTPLIETPQSISVVGAQEVETIKAQSLMDALGYVAGVARVEGADRTTESLIIRGFEAWTDNGSLYRDGIKYGVNLNNGTQEPYGLERIELLKGAASVLYGAAAPGGIINTVSKRPRAETMREINVEAGSFGRKQLSGDFTGAWDESAVWTYRLTFLARDSDTFIEHVPDNRLYLAPALTWRPSAATSLTLLSEYQQDRTAYIYALPPEGTATPNPNGRIPINRFQGEPGFDKYDNQRGSVGYLFEHAFDEQAKLRHSLRLYNQANARPFTYYSALQADMRTLARGQVDVSDDSRAVTTDTSVEYKWASGAVTHTTLVGLDYTYQRHSQATRTASVADLDIYAPSYGATPGAFAYAGKRQARDSKLGVYAQDQMKINDKLVLLLGGRQDWSKNDSRPASAPTPAPWLNEKNDAFTGRAGLVYLFDNGFAPFLSYSQSFEPTSGIDSITNSRLKPTRGEQYEAGWRYQPTNSNTLLTFAAYQLTKDNAVVYDPASNPRQLGRARSRGYEFEARTRIAQGTNLSAAYAYTEARSTDPYAAQQEKRTGGVPLNQVSLWADHEFSREGLPGFKAGAGIRYVDKTKASYIDDVVVPAFGLVDAMVSYSTGPWRLALNATNLADKHYVASCTYGCFYGEPRKVIGTATYRW